MGSTDPPSVAVNMNRVNEDPRVVGRQMRAQDYDLGYQF